MGLDGSKLYKRCQKLKNLNIYHSNHTCPGGVHIKCKKYSKQASITLKSMPDTKKVLLS